MNFEFNYHSTEEYSLDGESTNARAINTVLEYSEGTTWFKVLHDFAHFLGNVYGYDLTKQIAIADDDEFTVLRDCNI